MKPGDKVGGYELIRRIGRGGMAEVYLARKTEDILNKDIVIKLMHSHLSEDERFIKMFLREATIASRMNHMNVVQVLEVGQDGDEYFLAMEYLDGASLQSVAGRAWGAKLPIPLELVARAVGDSALGLHYAHTLTDEKGRAAHLVHRDISPDNLYLTRNGQTKVLDFGIATGAFTGRVTRTGELKGKVRYMSPEQIDGMDLDSRSDIFSLGVTAYRLLTGRPPFDGSNELQIMRSVVESDPKPPSAHNPHLPTAIDDLIMGMLAKDREKRTSSGEDIYETLSEYDGGRAGKKAVAEFIEKVLALPPNNKLEVPTWVTSKRPAVAPVGSGLLDAPPTPRESSADGSEEAAESSQPETAELSEAAAALRSQSTSDTLVKAIDLSAFADPVLSASDEGDELGKTIDNAVAPSFPTAEDQSLPDPAEVEAALVGFEETLRSSAAPGPARSKTPIIAVAAGAFLVGVIAVIALAGGDDEASAQSASVVVVDDPTGGALVDDPTAGDPAGDDPSGDGPSGDEPSGDEPSGDVPSGADPSGADPSGDEPTSDDLIGEDPSGADPSGDDPSGDDPSGEDPSGADPSGDEPTSDDPSGAEPRGDAPDPAAATADSSPDKPTRRTRRTARRRTTKSPDKAGPASLQFRIVPYGEVILDGSKLGTTPLPPVKVAPGKHFVIIKMKDKKKRVNVSVGAGEAKIIRVNMNTD
jgi:serine/threonine-protein kinase